MNVPGSFRCEPKESGKIKPVIQGESIEFFCSDQRVIFMFFFCGSLCRSCSRFGTVVLGSWDMGIDQVRQEEKKDYPEEEVL